MTLSTLCMNITMKRKAVLTNYANSEGSFTLCVCSITREQLHETVVSKAESPSRFVQDFIRGLYSALSGFLMKTKAADYYLSTTHKHMVLLGDLVIRFFKMLYKHTNQLCSTQSE